MLLSGLKSFSLGRQHLAFFGVQLILIKQGMGRNVRHICRLLQQLAQDLELMCRCPASCSSLCWNFLLQFEWGSLIKSLKSRAFAQYAPLPSLQSTITCNLFTHNERASDLSRCLELCLCEQRVSSHSSLSSVIISGSVKVDMHAFTALNYWTIDGWLEHNETLGLLSVLSKRLDVLYRKELLERIWCHFQYLDKSDAKQTANID